MSELSAIVIRKAVPSDSGVLTEIAFAAKRHWNYPGSYMEIWKNELTIQPEYIRNTIVFVAEFQNRITGFYSIAENKNDCWSGEVFIEKGFWLEHIFVLPQDHRKGIGTSLLLHAKSYCKSIGVSCLKIFCDPFAAGFYEKSGAVFLYVSKSSIPGRDIPVYELNTML